MRTLLALCLCLCCSLQLCAEPANLAQQDEQPLLSEALYDPSGQLTIDQVASSADFRPRDTVDIPLLRPTASALWLRFQISRQAGSEAVWWLALSDTGLTEATLYQHLGQAGYRRQQAGNSQPFSARPLPFRQVLFPLNLDEGGGHYYLRLQSRDDFASSLLLRSPERMALLEHDKGIVYGLIYGGIAALALYNLFMMRSLREPLYLPYVMASVAALLTILALNGHGYQYLWPGWPWLALHDTLLFSALWVAMFRRYACRLLELRSSLPRLNRLGAILVGCIMLAVALHLAGALQAGFWLSMVCYGLMSLYMLLVGGWRLWQGFRPARLFLAGNLLLCITVAVVILMVLGWLPTHWLVFQAIQIGVAVQSLLLSLALADRVRELRQEHEATLEFAFEAQREQISQLRRHEEELENRVLKRTTQLATANEQLLDEIDARRRVEQQLRNSEAQLRQQALHDPLTGLANRVLLADRLDHALARQPRRRVPCALMLLDLDHFKPVNDQHGHEVGDLLLREVAQRLRSAVRAADTVARLGGDEFVLLAELLTLDDATGLAIKLVQVVTAPYQLGELRLQIGVSIGIACYPGDGGDPDTLLRHADAAMYQVKRSGRNGYAFWQNQAGPQQSERDATDHR